MGEAWVRFGNAVHGGRQATATIANLHALNFEAHFGDQFFPSDQSIGSRLGAADRLVVFNSTPPGPFGQPVQQLALRHHQWPAGLATDAQPEDVEPLNGSEGPGFTFRLGHTRYRYNRLGITRCSADFCSS